MPFVFFEDIVSLSCDDLGDPLSFVILTFPLLHLTDRYTGPEL